MRSTKAFSFLLALTLVILAFTIAKKRTKVYTSSYLTIVSYPADNANYDYHNIQFYQNSLKYNIADEMSFYSANDLKALFRMGDDNATYPQKSKDAEIVLQSDIVGGNISNSSITSFRKLLPELDLHHKKCYVAWDVTKKTKPISIYVDKTYYQMKIKYFNSLATMNNFYNSISTGDKFSQCGLKADNVRFKANFNNSDDIEVSSMYPLILNYYSCIPTHFLDLTNPISNSSCQPCPNLQKPTEDRLSCKVVNNNNYLILINKDSPAAVDVNTSTVYSHKVKAILTDNPDEALIMYKLSDSPKVYIDNSNPILVESSNAFNQNPLIGTTLNTFTFNPRFLPLYSNTCPVLYPLIFQYVYENSKGEISLDIRYGYTLSNLSICFVWYDQRDAGYTNQGTYEALGGGEALLAGKWASYNSFPSAYLGPMSQFDNDYSNKAFTGPYYCTIDIELDPAEFNDGDGIDFSCANSSYNSAKSSTTTADYGAEYIFHLTKVGGNIKIGSSKNTGYVPNPLDGSYTGVTAEILAGSGKKWYTFKHRFYNDSGTVKVNLTVSCTGCTNPVFDSLLEAGPVGTTGGTRNYRFFFINKKTGDSLKIRNFNRVFESLPVTQPTNNCEFKYARVYTCISSSFALIAQLNKDENYSKYLPKYPLIDYTTAKKATGY